MRTLLLVLESEEMRTALEDALRHDFTVNVCRGDAIFSELTRMQYDAMLLDLCLAGTDGFAILEEVKDQLPPIVVLFTSYIDESVIQQADEYGVACLIRIPCSASSVVRHLHNV